MFGSSMILALKLRLPTGNMSKSLPIRAFEFELSDRRAYCIYFVVSLASGLLLRIWTGMSMV